MKRCTSIINQSVPMRCKADKQTFLFFPSPLFGLLRSIKSAIISRTLQENWDSFFFQNNSHKFNECQIVEWERKTRSKQGKEWNSEKELKWKIFVKSNSPAVFGRLSDKYSQRRAKMKNNINKKWERIFFFCKEKLKDMDCDW